MSEAALAIPSMGVIYLNCTWAHEVILCQQGAIGVYLCIDTITKGLETLATSGIRLVSVM